MKSALISAPILGYPIPNKQFILDTDASDKSTGAVLSQTQNGKETVIAYLSKTLNKHEQSYCVTRKELLAVVHALKSFHHYLYGQPVLLRTDNAAVSWMKNLKQPTGQVARWLELLGTYNLNVTHRPGIQHRNADALSRAPCSKCSKQQNGNLDEVSDNNCSNKNNNLTLNSLNNSITSNTSDKQDIINASQSEMTRAITRSNSDNNSPFLSTQIILSQWSPSELRTLQLKDPDLNIIMLHLDQSNDKPSWQEISHSSSVTKTLWRMWDRLSLENGVLFKNWFDDENNSHMQLVVPKEKQSDVFHYMHNIPSSAHLGFDKTLAKIRQDFYWPGMKDTIEKFCAKCHSCASRKPPKPTKSPLGRINASQPFERVAVDIFGPLPKTESGNIYVLVICDCFTRWTEAIAIPNQEAETIAKAFVNEFVSRFGVPLQIHSDQGSNFVSKLFTDMCDLLQIYHTRSTALHP